MNTSTLSVGHLGPEFSEVWKSTVIIIQKYIRKWHLQNIDCFLSSLMLRIAYERSGPSNWLADRQTHEIWIVYTPIERQRSIMFQPAEQNNHCSLIIRPTKTSHTLHWKSTTLYCRNPIKFCTINCFSEAYKRIICRCWTSQSQYEYKWIKTSNAKFT